MKLIIDIDEDTYKSVIADSTTYVLDEILVENAIYNGIPLEDIKAEIKKQNIADFIAVQSVLDIIDKHIGVKNDKRRSN